MLLSTRRSLLGNLTKGTASHVFLAGKPWGDVVTGEYWAGSEVVKAYNFLAYGYGARLTAPSHTNSKM